MINQTYKPIEHIIVDDGSTDNSSRIIESFGNRVRLLSQQNMGVSHARNRGLLEAKGEYILFLDGDDILHEKALENLINLIKNPNSGGCKKFCVNRHFAGNCNFQKWNKNDYTIIIT